ncbi:hypothetical protein NQ318_022530 [Aromia moschata]|uniref:PiggyBac transposable element-derived protein domain-containing protein n=1 Tax=Aromia moschata TaxID=1265417 RepID=A0AAV8XL92_9CUCU|nr:hypothetical protein NQ318_022530 [Aromia moschata]
MDPAIPGPSRPKRSCIQRDVKRPLTEDELRKHAESFLDSSDDEPFVESEDSWAEAENLEDSDRAEDEIINNDPEDGSSDDGNSNDAQTTFVWNDTPALENIIFSGNPGLRVPHPGNNAYDFFSLLVTDELLNHIVEQTNVYAEEVFLIKSTKEKSRITEWKDVTLKELKVFLGIWFHMGNIRINRLQDYWKKDELFAIPGLQKHMSRNRFMLIMRCLHFSKNPTKEDDPGYGDRLHRIRFLQDYFNRRMAEVYYPGKQLSLDESMVLWRGRLGFRQFIKGKKHKFGMKLYILAEPNGLTLRCFVYSGAQGELGGTGHAEKVVMSLMKGLENKGHALYMDNFYNSVVNNYCKTKLMLRAHLEKEEKEPPKLLQIAK